MFFLDAKEEVLLKAQMKAQRVPHTKLLPVRYSHYIYNLRLLQAIFKKADKRGQSTITRIRLLRQGNIEGNIVIDYKTQGGKGSFTIQPLYNVYGNLPYVTATYPIEEVIEGKGNGRNESECIYVCAN